MAPMRSDRCGTASELEATGESARNVAVTGATLKNSHVALHLTGADGKPSELKVDHIIAATGFQTDISRLGFLDEPVKRKIATQRGAPLLSKNFESSVPGLYFVGMPSAPTFGPVMRFAVGSRFTADRLSRHLAPRG